VPSGSPLPARRTVRRRPELSRAEDGRGGPGTRLAEAPHPRAQNWTHGERRAGANPPNIGKPPIRLPVRRSSLSAWPAATTERTLWSSATARGWPVKCSRRRRHGCVSTRTPSWTRPPRRAARTASVAASRYGASSLPSGGPSSRRAPSRPRRASSSRGAGTAPGCASRSRLPRSVEEAEGHATDAAHRKRCGGRDGVGLVNHVSARARCAHPPTGNSCRNGRVPGSWLSTAATAGAFSQPRSSSTDEAAMRSRSRAFGFSAISRRTCGRRRGESPHSSRTVLETPFGLPPG
jgi:hypothetical protein